MDSSVFGQHDRSCHQFSTDGFSLSLAFFTFCVTDNPARQDREGDN